MNAWGGLARTARRHGPARLARCAGIHSARARGTGGLPGLGRHRRTPVAAPVEPGRGQGGGPPPLARRWPSCGLSRRSGDHERPTEAGPLRITVGKDCAESTPAVPASIAHADGVAVALAALDPTGGVGIDIEPIVERPGQFRDHGVHGRAEQALLSRWSADRVAAKWISPSWCAMRACCQGGRAAIGGVVPATAEVIDVCEESGVIQVRLATELVTAGPDEVCDNPLRVVSDRRGHRAWAWTIGKGFKP